MELRLHPAELLREVTLKHDRSRNFIFESEIVIEAVRQGVAYRNCAGQCDAAIATQPLSSSAVLYWADYEDGGVEVAPQQDLPDGALSGHSWAE